MNLHLYIIVLKSLSPDLNHRAVIVSLSLVKVIDDTAGRFVAGKKLYNFQGFEFMVVENGGME